MSRLLFLPSLAMFAACAEPAFSVHARDNAIEDIQRTLAQAGAGAPASGPRNGHPTAYLVTTAPKHLVAYDLEAGKILWDVEADVTSRVVVGRGFVAHRQGAGEVAVRGAADGALRCTGKLKAGQKFLGLAADERVYYVAQSSGTAERVSFAVGLSPDTCVEAWRDEASGSLGAPAARGGVVAVPYAYQNLVFLDGKTGAEVARVRNLDESITFARADAAGFTYGANSGVYRFDPKSATGSRKGSSVVAARMASSRIRSFYYYDSYQQAQADYTVFDRNRMLWRIAPPKAGADPASPAPPEFEGGAAFLHSYRFFFAFDAQSGAIRWAYAHPKVDVVGADDTGPALLFACADGDLGALDARSGVMGWTRKSGLKVAGVTFDADGFNPAPGGTAAPVADTLASIVWDPDQRFSAAKVFAVDAMTRVPGRDVTAQLVKIVLQHRVVEVTQKAAEALLTRKDSESVPLYREALSVHYDYLGDLSPRGTDALARVSAVVSDHPSSELLARHLFDPWTPLPAMKEIARSIVALGGKEALKPLREFLIAYRCDAIFNSDPSSLQVAAEGLLTLGGPEERRVVTFVAGEPRTLPALAAYLHKLIAEREPKPVLEIAPKAKPGEDRPDAIK